MLFIGILFIGCGKKTTAKKENRTNEDSIIKPLQVEESIDTTAIPFSKTLKGNGYVYTLEGIKRSNETIDFKSIGIFDKEILHQKIIVDTISVLNEGEAFFGVNQDINFDGLNDIELVNQAGNYTSSSSFWLYNKSTRRYERYKPLDTIINPKIDALKKKIISDYHVGPTDTYFKVYAWEKGKLVLQSVQINDDEGGTYQYRKNGKWITE
ncbi:XAC2610-related protein [Chryseobacterium sp. SIMBA_028]|uniref:XAC2610-related protein n=1 Tax=Chryseobacterium sp. SIMBA_028 TaxID=3085771 RepID=UPI00397D09EC